MEQIETIIPYKYLKKKRTYFAFDPPRTRPAVELLESVSSTNSGEDIFREPNTNRLPFLRWTTAAAATNDDLESACRIIGSELIMLAVRTIGAT